MSLNVKNASPKYGIFLTFFSLVWLEITRVKRLVGWRSCCRLPALYVVSDKTYLYWDEFCSEILLSHVPVKPSEKLGPDKILLSQSFHFSNTVAQKPYLCSEHSSPGRLGAEVVEWDLSLACKSIPETVLLKMLPFLFSIIISTSVVLDALKLPPSPSMPEQTLLHFISWWLVH